MNKQNVIPAVGQNWVEGDEEYGLPILELCKIDGDLVKIYRGIRGLSVKYFYENFTFMPSNDLEFVAVNCGKWDDEWRLIRKCGDSFDFSNSVTLDGEYTRNQWQDKRNELYGVTFDMNDVIQEDGGSTVKRHSVGNYSVQPKAGCSEVEIKPVFTKAMKDDGEDIQLGMIYHDENGDECEFIGENNVECVWIGKLTKDGVHPRHLSVSQRSECTAIDTRTPQEKQLDHVTHLVGSMSHLPHSETGKAIVDYINGDEG